MNGDQTNVFFIFGHMKQSTVEPVFNICSGDKLFVP
jgi:hypothetical protein